MGELRENTALRDRVCPFRDRTDGAGALAALIGPNEANLLAIPPGGVPVATALAKELDQDYGLFLAQEIADPLTGEALGGVAWGGRTVWDRDVLRRSGLGGRKLRSLRRRAIASLHQRARKYGVRPAVPDNPGMVLIDDGTSGWAMLVAAVREARSLRPWVALAVPAMARSEAMRLINEVDVLYCPCLVADDHLSERKGLWGRPVSEPEALTMWHTRGRGQKNSRYLYQTVSSSSGISHVR